MQWCCVEDLKFTRCLSEVGFMTVMDKPTHRATVKIRNIFPRFASLTDLYKFQHNMDKRFVNHVKYPDYRLLLDCGDLEYNPTMDYIQFRLRIESKFCQFNPCADRQRIVMEKPEFLRSVLLTVLVHLLHSDDHHSSDIDLDVRQVQN